MSRPSLRARRDHRSARASMPLLHDHRKIAHLAIAPSVPSGCSEHPEAFYVMACR